MANDNEMVEQVCEEMHGVRNGQHANGGRLYERYLMRCQIAEDYADRVLAAHKREMAEKDKEIEKLCALVNGLADVVSIARPKFCNGCPGALCSLAGEPCGFVSQADELVARAREVVK